MCPLEPAVTLTARSTERLFHLVFESHDGRAPGADSEEKHEPVSDIDTVVLDSLKALDPEWPIREAAVSNRSKVATYSITSSAARFHGAAGGTARTAVAAAQPVPSPSQWQGDV